MSVLMLKILNFVKLVIGTCKIAYKFNFNFLGWESENTFIFGYLVDTNFIPK